jgi:osmotically-inducible protein OsmY
MQWGVAMTADDQMRRDVIRELEWDPQVSDAAAIGVAVQDGAVTLTGRAASYSESQAAVRAAARVSGVRAVADELKIQLPEQPRDDADIARAIAHVLDWDAQVPDDVVQATVQAGWVDLTGEVEADYQRREAERMVRNIRGVTGITNNLTVAPRRRRRASAADTEAEIEEAFRRSAGIKAAHLRVKVTDHTAELYGEVHSLAEASAAWEAAASAPGVAKLENHLVVLP